MSGYVNPFSSAQATTQLTRSPIFPIPAKTSTTPTPTLSPLQPIPTTEIVTETKLHPATSKVSPVGTNTLTLSVPEGKDHNNNHSNNTIGTAAIIFSIMIAFVIVGGCITLIFTRKRNPENKKRTEIVQRNRFGEESYESNESNERIIARPINSISPPLNLPPPPPQRSPIPPSSPRNSLPLPPIPQHPSPSPPPTFKHPSFLPPIPQHSPIILYRNASLKRNGSRSNHDFLTSENHYQRYSQLRPSSTNSVEDLPT